MAMRGNVWLLGLSLICFLGSGTGCLAEQVELLGVLEIPGHARDLSGLKEPFAGGVTHDQLGGFSAIAYSAHEDVYYLLPDRGPKEAGVPYQCRFHKARLKVQPGQLPVLQFELVETCLLQTEQGEPLLGSAQLFDRRNPDRSVRFDPEGLRIGANGTIYVVDEYGPHLWAFNAQGRLQRRFETPAHLKISHPAESKGEENRLNSQGRQGNKGFEGVALSAEESRVYALLQGPLLQDGAFAESGKKAGRYLRLLEFADDSSATREFVYELEQAGHGVSEIERFDETRLLVLERDSKTGTQAEVKRLYLADLAPASNIAGTAQLSADALPRGVHPLAKTLFLDLLDPRFQLKEEQIPAKVEGVAFGPDLPDGRRLLLICTDNDFSPAEPSLIYALAISR